MRQLNCDTGLGVTSPLIHPSVKNCHSEHEDQDKPDGQGSAFGFQGLVVQWLNQGQTEEQRMHCSKLALGQVLHQGQGMKPSQARVSKF